MFVYGLPAAVLSHYFSSSELILNGSRDWPACLYRGGGCTLDCSRCGHCMPRRAGGQMRRPSGTVIRLVFLAVMVCLCCQRCAYRRPWSAVVIAV